MSNRVSLRQKGFTLLELLVSLAVTGVMFAGALSFFTDVSWRSRDTALGLTAFDEARSVMNLLVSEISLAGSGVPFTQSNFTPGSTGLGDAPLPLLTTSTSNQITFRSSRRGSVFLITSNYTPAPSNRTFSLFSTSGLSVGDTIYLSNALRGGSSGLSGTLTSVTSNTVTIANGYVMSAGATFEAGSTAQAVETVTYSATNFEQGIWRSDTRGTLQIASRASLLFTYLDRSLQPLSLPMSTSTIGTQLSAVRVALRYAPRKELRLKPDYEITLTRTIPLRNLLVSG